MVTIKFPDGSKKKYDAPVTGESIAQSIGEGLAKAAVAVMIDDEPCDLSQPIEKDCNLRILTLKEEKGIDILRHSTAHVLAQAVLELYPKTKLTIGPVIENGFYYDFDAKPFTPEDLGKIEAHMKETIKRNLEITREEISKAQAKEVFKGNKYKLELIEEHEERGLTIYKQGEFLDLCKGPHLPNTNKIPLDSFKLTKISGSYWRGDAKNAALQRIYAVQFATKKDLKKYLYHMEEAVKRDHRKLGQKLDLFSFHEYSPGSPFFHPYGTIIYNELLEFMRKEQNKRGFKEMLSPQIYHNELWKTSGHWGHYKENMFCSHMDGEEVAIKPMSCPGHSVWYRRTVHSYRELPLRIAEFGVCHRNELRGVLGGLTRVRKFQQDDAHIFLAPEMIKDEIKMLMEFIDFVYKTLGFEYHVELSTKPEKAMGDDKIWERAEKALADALKEIGTEYQLNPGDGAFYGPKIDFHVKDAIGRSWQCGTLQLDFNLPEAFDLTYEGKDGKSHRVAMIHRAIFGSIERLFGILIEQYSGKFPLWLSPVQAVILTVADKFNDYAEKVKKELEKSGLRVETDFRSESVSKKVRDAQVKYIPYILVVGEKEVKEKNVTVRTRDGKVHGAKKVTDLIKQMKKEIEDKSS